MKCAFKSLCHAISSTLVCVFSLFDSFSAEQKAALDAFTQAVYSAKILDDIYKLIITRQVFTRFLAASGFDQGRAVDAIRDFIAWRRRF